MKTCTICQKEKLFSQFHADKSRKDGYRNRCKECISLYMKSHYEQDKGKAKKRVYAWVEKNRSRHNEKCARWVKNNRGKVNARTARRYASKKQATPKWVTKNLDYSWMISEAYDLALLRSKLTEQKWEVDHIVPLRGKNVSGLHTPWNLQVVLQTENRKKSNSFRVAVR
jgi:5-methylcytosine-specific restriction endonuclease McrA